MKPVELEVLPVSAADLDVLTKSLESHHPLESLALRSVHLYCGATWASILDEPRPYLGSEEPTVKQYWEAIESNKIKDRVA